VYAILAAKVPTFNTIILPRVIEMLILQYCRPVTAEIRKRQ